VCAVPTKDIPAAVRQLSRGLDQARQEWNASSDSGRQAMIVALAAVSNFISSVDLKCGLKYSTFHMVLIAALHDLEDGVITPILKHKNIGRGRRSGFSRRQLDWHAAATMRSLMDIGIKRPGAAKKVSDALRRCGVSNATVRSVTDCYDRQKVTWHGFYAAGTNEYVNEGRRKGLTQKPNSGPPTDKLSFHRNALAASAQQRWNGGIRFRLERIFFGIDCFY